MKLKDFLETLMTPNAQMTLIDLNTDAEIACMKVAGYESLDDTIQDREVKQWYIVSSTAIKIVLGDVVEP